MGFVKNLDIISSSLAMQKRSEWEAYAKGMASSAQILSTLISDPETYLDQTYLDNYEQYIASITDLAQCRSLPCEHEGVTYEFYFEGDVFQNGVHNREWSNEQKERYQKNINTLI